MCSNSFINFSWYDYLRNFSSKLIIFFIIIRSIYLLFFEYMFQVLENQISFNNTNLNLTQLKII
ncbi:DMT family protein [Candidatus Coxiella mudrowiae]|uniref:DMT family protein n=1 Tax=Candidatus Coxiella mudrowiae TaxID=2054173 RepID=UPI00352FE4DF